MKQLKKIYENNTSMVISAIIALIAVTGVLIFVKTEVDRFIFIMPIFAGWILFNILMLPDDDEGTEKNLKKEKNEKTEDKKKKKK